MAVGDLATLSDVKSWLSISDTSSDALLQRLISSCSGTVRSYMNRFSLAQQTYTDLVDGTGTRQLLLRNWPVTSVAQVVVDGALIPEAPPVPTTPLGYTTFPDGWVLQTWDGHPPGGPQLLELRGWYFRHGRRNVQVTYTAGYGTSEAATVPASAPYTYTPVALLGPWSQDVGVAYASSGVALAEVSGSPAQGQYSVSSSGVYTFSAADEGQAVVVSYSYVPLDLEQLVIEWVAERSSYRSRIGVRSKSLGGQETISYASNGIPAYIAQALQPWCDVVVYPR